MVLLIGNLIQEGVTTKVRALGYGHKQKLPFSSPSNWESIIEWITALRQAESLVAVFVHLTESTIFLACHPSYQDLWLVLLDELKQARSLVFIYESNLEGEFSFEFYRRYRRRRLPLFDPDFADDPRLVKEAQRDWYTNPLQNAPPRTPDLVAQGKQRIREVFAHDIEVVPYGKRIDLTLRIQQYLDDVEGGIFFRLYVPKNRYQAEQLEGFLRLFEHYLRDIEGQLFSIDLRKTQHGLVYVFKGEGAVSTAKDLSTAISRFENFINLCENDTGRARAMLSDMRLEPARVESLISRYLRDYQRLVLDIRHEYEQKTLALRQMLENEALEVGQGDVARVLTYGQPSTLLFLSHNLGTININVPTTLIHDSEFTQSAFEQTIYGDVTYNAEDSQLLALFDKYAERLEAVQLKSTLDELKDETSPEEVRQTAKQKIASFLYKIAPIIGESLVKGLAEYLRKTLAGL